MAKKTVTETEVMDSAEVEDQGVDERNLAVVGDRDMDVYVPEGMEDISRDDLVIPRLRIVQPVSEEGTAGNYLLNITGEEFETLDVVFFKFSKGRVYFSDNLKEGVLCGSHDRKTPSGYIETPMAESCLNCIYAQWGKKDDGKPIPPSCAETYNMLGYIVSDGMPFFISFKGTAIRPVKLFLSGIAFRGRKARADMRQFQVTMGLKQNSNEKGKFFVPTFSAPELLKDDPFAAEFDIYGQEEDDFREKAPVAEEGGDGAPADGSSF